MSLSIFHQTKYMYFQKTIECLYLKTRYTCKSSEDYTMTNIEDRITVTHQVRQNCGDKTNSVSGAGLN